VTLFGRFRSQPSGKTGGQHGTDYHVTVRTGESMQSKAGNTDDLPTHFMI